jgi:hypothetical protein
MLLLLDLELGDAVEASIDFKVVVDYNFVVKVRDSSAFDLRVLVSHQIPRGTSVPISYPGIFDVRSGNF